MIATLALIATLGSTPSPSGPVKIAAPMLEGVQLSEELTAFYSDHFAQQLASNGLKVTNPRDVSQVLGLERQRELLSGKAEDEGQLIEIGRVLGVEGLVSGSIARLESAYQVNLRIIHARTAETLTTFSERVRTEEELLDTLNRAARRMAPATLKALRPEEQALADAKAAEIAARRNGARQWSWVPIAASAVLGVIGGSTIVEANKIDARLRHPAPDYTPARAFAELEEARGRQVLGGTLLTVGVAGVLTGAGLYLFGGGSDAPKVSVVPSGEPSIVIQGAF